MQTVASWIWAKAMASISYEDNRYTSSASSTGVVGDW